MKALLLSAILVFASMVAHAQDVSKLLDDNQCKPVRQNDGRISAFECEGSLGQIAEVSGDANEESVADANKPLSLDESSTQKIKMKLALSLNGKVVARPQIITALNQSAQVTELDKKSNQQYIIEALPTIPNAKNPDFVLMQFKVTQIIKGQAKILSGSSILAKTNKTAQIEIHTEEPKDKIKTVSIQVTPTWVQSQTF